MKIHVIDSHTGGEPTRVVLEGGPDLGLGSLRHRRDVFRETFDRFRSAIVNEPRGSDAVVGALVCEPQDPACSAGVIFFNNVGYLNMCGHGTIGLVATLAYLGKIKPGLHRIETPVGTVAATLHQNADVTMRNLPCYRYAKDVRILVDGFGEITGDVAWGGNWFYLVQETPVAVDFPNIDALTDFTWRVRQALTRHSVTGAKGAEIDHIEVFGPPQREDAHSKNFVLCPGKAYDRSACGTGTSAKLACLHADGKLREGETWRQESITGTLFEGSFEICGGEVYPLIKGTAFVTAEATLVLDDRDPFCWGIRA